MKIFDAEKLLNDLNRVSVSSDPIPVRVGLVIAKNRRSLANALAPFFEMKHKIVNDFKEPGKTKVEEGDPGYEKAKEKMLQLYAENVDAQFDSISEADIESLNLPISTISAISEFVK